MIYDPYNMGHLEWSRIYNIQRDPRMKYEDIISNLDIELQHALA